MSPNWFYGPICRLPLLAAQHPEVQATAQQEVDRVLGNSDVVTSEMEKELKYVANCVKESQRLIPVVTGFSRGAKEDTELGGRVFIEERSIICFQRVLLSRLIIKLLQKNHVYSFLYINFSLGP